MSIDMEDQYYTPAQIAHKFLVTVSTVRTWINNGDLSAVKMGKSWRIPHSAVVEFADKKFGHDS